MSITKKSIWAGKSNHMQGKWTSKASHVEFYKNQEKGLFAMIQKSLHYESISSIYVCKLILDPLYKDRGFTTRKFKNCTNGFGLGV